MTKKEVLIILMIAIAICSRFLFLKDGQSILPNFTAIGAVALLGATQLRGVKKYMMPLLALWVSDLVLNNVVYAKYHDGFQFMGNLWVYGTMILIGIMAYYLMQKRSWTRLAVTSTLAAVIFYLVTNFGAWVGSTMYPQNLEGLMMSYEAGIPFFRNTLLGNLFYSFALFGLYEYFAHRTDLLQPFMQSDKSTFLA